ncbi:xanthine dehydrogenase family protein molybdopterin-binding subunit [Aquirufa antheringensis]|jgi:isoquinoline 1-oxidoreductase beta subunit|uniref:xanthine dehydrogenase family protein molybdopterin-binding subunit n=1 Tax=Aquirufa antheringensis TaxID=2516559 RepID=UPI0022A985D0|nr:molybdopterin cofactor-binding domain-containing protein [Aquirufa antheringensis]MCZ2484843.1 xanthine dehydrogenase family protein molybdopterin-binding subunit [Aquirufa antheringensis]
MSLESRRSFIKKAGATGLTFWLGLSYVKGESTAVISTAKSLTPFIKIDAAGITIFNPNPEMGQGSYQAVASMIAEELEVSLDQITIKNTSGEKEFGAGQWAGGSSTVREGYLTYRKIGASAKEMLVKAASQTWGVSPASCTAKEGKVLHAATNRTLKYEELAEAASLLEIPKEPKLKDPKDFKMLGKSVKRPDIPLKVTGKAEFGIDADVPGMLYSSVERCPVIGGTLKTFDATAAMKVPGVVKVVSAERVIGKYSSTGVAVIAKTYWAAIQGRKALKIDWDTKGFETFNSSDYEHKLRSLSKEEGILDKQKGSVDLPVAQVVESFYETPMVAHHPLEPMNCTVHVKGKKVEIWTSTQVPVSVTGPGMMGSMPALVGINPEDITLHAGFIGGGFGRRLYFDYIVEAINVAKQVDSPVKVVWSREDTTTQGPFRPMTFSKMIGGLSEKNQVVSFQHKVISPGFMDSAMPNWDKTKLDSMMTEGISAQEYDIPNMKNSFVFADYHVPMAAWRSVTSSTLAFAHECFIDELAHKAEKDPLDFRIDLQSTNTDTKRVLKKLREITNWDKPLPAGKARGVAQWDFFAGLSAQAVEVSLAKNGAVSIDKVYVVIDLGTVVNPDNVKAQVEGAVLMALSAAIHPAITLKNGVVEQKNFDTTPVTRMSEAPEVIVEIITEGAKIKGVGEPGLPPFAPALGNAIFALTKKRLRKLPLEIEFV